MEVTGSLPSQAERQQLWNTLTNIENWKEAIPEAQSYEKLGDNQYQMTVKMEIGPIKGDQTIKILFADQEPPTNFNFELQHSMVKSVKGNFNLKEPTASDPAAEEVPVGTKTVLDYKLDADAGNPFVNAMMEGFKGKVKEGFDELLGRLESKAQAA